TYVPWTVRKTASVVRGASSCDERGRRCAESVRLKKSAPCAIGIGLVVPCCRSVAAYGRQRSSAPENEHAPALTTSVPAPSRVRMRSVCRVKRKSTPAYVFTEPFDCSTSATPLAHAGAHETQARTALAAASA